MTPGRATAHATGSGDTDIAAHVVERRTRDSGERVPLYAVLDRRESGEWRTLDEFVDPVIACRVCALLISMGADAKVELVEQSIP